MSAVAVVPQGSAVPAPAVVPRAYRHRPTTALGDPSALVCTVARTALTGVLGAEGLHTLHRWVEPEVLTALKRQHSLARRTSVSPQGTVHVARVRLCRVTATTVEAAIVAREGDRAHPIAMRLEAVHGKWLVTALDIG